MLKGKSKMPLLTVKRNNDEVEILIETDLAHTCNGSEITIIPFTWKMNQVYAADMLARYIEKRIYNAVAEARHKAYNDGWKDAKAKNPKRSGTDWFSGMLLASSRQEIQCSS